jgi:hypothetical protein
VFQRRICLAVVKIIRRKHVVRAKAINVTPALGPMKLTSLSIIILDLSVQRNLLLQLVHGVNLVVAVVK